MKRIKRNHGLRVSRAKYLLPFSVIFAFAAGLHNFWPLPKKTNGTKSRPLHAHRLAFAQG
jgi:hypothetical protein